MACKVRLFRKQVVPGKQGRRCFTTGGPSFHFGLSLLQTRLPSRSTLKTSRGRHGQSGSTSLLDGILQCSANSMRKSLIRSSILRRSTTISPHACSSTVFHVIGECEFCKFFWLEPGRFRDSVSGEIPCTLHRGFWQTEVAKGDKTSSALQSDHKYRRCSRSYKGSTPVRDRKR